MSTGWTGEHDKQSNEGDLYENVPVEGIPTLEKIVHNKAPKIRIVESISALPAACIRV